MQATRETLCAHREEQGLAEARSGPWGPKQGPEVRCTAKESPKGDRRNGGGALYNDRTQPGIVAGRTLWEISV